MIAEPFARLVAEVPRRYAYYVPRRMMQTGLQSKGVPRRALLYVPGW